MPIRAISSPARTTSTSGCRAIAGSFLSFLHRAYVLLPEPERVAVAVAIEIDAARKLPSNRSSSSTNFFGDFPSLAIFWGKSVVWGRYNLTRLYCAKTQRGHLKSYLPNRKVTSPNNHGSFFCVAHIPLSNSSPLSACAPLALAGAERSRPLGKKTPQGHGQKLSEDGPFKQIQGIWWAKKSIIYLYQLGLPEIMTCLLVISI